MPRGAPDWYMYRRGLGQDAMDDLLEQAARLGSIVLHDRRGDIVYLEDFAAGFNRWDSAVATPASTVNLSALTARHGNISVELHADDAADEFAQLIGQFPYPDPTRLGLECAFTVDNHSDHISWVLRVYDNVDDHYARAEYFPNTNLLRLLPAPPGWYNITTTLDLYADDHHFHIFKMVIDLVTDMYVRLIIDDVEYDISAVPLNVAPDPATNPYQRVEIENYTNATDESDVYIDDVILTYNEPTNV